MNRLVILTVLLTNYFLLNSQVSAEEIELPEGKTQTTSKYQLSKLMSDKLIESMVWIEGGQFIMGSDSKQARKREKPAHKVTLDGFYLSKFEVTQELFVEIMGWNTSYFACENCPVNNLSWFNMQLFIERLNIATGKKFRFPTEAEWEFAAKGGTLSKNFTYSGSNNIDEIAWYAENSKRRSHPVGQKKPNELGLYDMTGNLWEFCQDNMSRSAYTLTESHNPLVGSFEVTKKKAMKVLRGSGYEFSAEESLVFLRDGATNNVRMADIGFRLAMSQ